MTIEEARTQVGMSRQDVSDWLEILYITLINWENGERKCPDYVERLYSEKNNQPDYSVDDVFDMMHKV